MIRKKRFYIYILLIFAVILTVFIVIKPKNEQLSDKFNIKNAEDINTIEIVHQTDTLTIKKIDNSSEWMINNKYPADSDAIKKLFRCLTESKINKPASKEQNDSVLNKIYSEQKTVSVFNRKNRLLKKWHLAPYTDNENGTYMISDNEIQAYEISIPGLVKDLNYKYNSNLTYWINPLIFSYKPSEINSIIIRFADTTFESFRIENIQQSPNIFSLTTNKTIENTDENKIKNYLSYFMDVKFSSYKQINDSILNTTADFQVIVNDIKNQTKTVKLYKIKDHTAAGGYDINRLYATINDEDIVIVKYFDIDLILKEINYFIK
jgi:hypothetical protein